MIAGHVLRTGDIGYMDEGGYVFIEDRKKDMILVSGFNVYPNEVEASRSRTRRARGSGRRTAGRACGRGRGAVRREEGSCAHRGRTDRALPQVAHRLQGAETVYFRNELPKTNVGKILRRELRASSSRDARRAIRPLVVRFGAMGDMVIALR